MSFFSLWSDTLAGACCSVFRVVAKALTPTESQSIQRRFGQVINAPSMSIPARSEA